MQPLWRRAFFLVVYMHPALFTLLSSSFFFLIFTSSDISLFSHVEHIRAKEQNTQDRHTGSLMDLVMERVYITRRGNKHYNSCNKFCMGAREDGVLAFTVRVGNHTSGTEIFKSVIWRMRRS